MSASFGLGAVLGTALMVAIGPRLPRRWTYAVAFLIAGAPRFVALAMSAPFPIILATWAVAGLAAGDGPIRGGTAVAAGPGVGHGRGAVVGRHPVRSLGRRTAGQQHQLEHSIAIMAAVYFVATLDPFVRPAWKLMDRQPVVEPAADRLAA
jgi:hypothetical protein